MISDQPGGVSIVTGGTVPHVVPHGTVPREAIWLPLIEGSSLLVTEKRKEIFRKGLRKVLKSGRGYKLYTDKCSLGRQVGKQVSWFHTYTCTCGPYTVNWMYTLHSRGRATGETVFTTAATFSQRPAQMIVLTHQYLDHLLHYSSDLKVIKVTGGK